MAVPDPSFRNNAPLDVDMIRVLFLPSFNPLRSETSLDSPNPAECLTPPPPPAGCRCSIKRLFLEALSVVLLWVVWRGKFLEFVENKLEWT